jgi:hypothetical protein
LIGRPAAIPHHSVAIKSNFVAHAARPASLDRWPVFLDFTIFPK